MISENSAKKPDHRTRPHSEESKRKASAALRGNTNARKPAEALRVKISVAVSPETLAVLEKTVAKSGLSRGRVIDLAVAALDIDAAAGN